MVRATLAPGAEAAGHRVFKLGIAGIGLGLAVRFMPGAEAQGDAMDVWLTYALSVAMAGAVIGSVAGIVQSRTRAERTNRTPIPPPQIEPAPAPPATAPARPRVSAFRGTQRRALR